MSNNDGPWSEPPRPRPTGRWRIWAYLGLIGASVGMIWILAKLFPGQVVGSDWVYPALDVGFLAVVARGILGAKSRPIKQVATYIAIWAGLAAVLVLGYTYRSEFADLGQRVRSQLVPAYAAQTAPGVVALSRSENGGYYVIGKVNGQPIRFLVDTGASDIVLSPADARRLGIDTAALTFDDIHETANGAGRGARFTLDSLAIGPIQLRDVPVSINQADMSESLLGMTFLKRLDSFEFKGERLLLRFHGA